MFWFREVCAAKVFVLFHKCVSSSDGMDSASHQLDINVKACISAEQNFRVCSAVWSELEAFAEGC